MTSKNKLLSSHTYTEHDFNCAFFFLELNKKICFLSNSFENLIANVFVKLTNGTISLLCLS